MSHDDLAARDSPQGRTGRNGKPNRQGFLKASITDTTAPNGMFVYQGGSIAKVLMNVESKQSAGFFPPSALWNGTC